MRPVSGHPPFATGYRRPYADRRHCEAGRAARSRSRHTRCDGAAHSARHRQMSRRTEHWARPVPRSSLLHSNFWFPTRGHPARFTHCLARASGDRKVSIGRHIAAGSTNRAANCLRTVESIVRWCTRYCSQHRARYISYKNQPARCDQATARWKFPRFQQLHRETGLDRGGH